MKQNLISRQQASDLLGVSTRTLDRYVKARKLKAHKRGRATMFVREDVEAMLSAEPQPQIETAAIAVKDEQFSNQLEGLTELVGKMHNELTKKNQQIAQLNYQLGEAQQKLEHSIPLLQAQNSAHQNENLRRTIGNQKLQIYSLLTLLAICLGVVGVGVSFWL